MTSLTKLSNLTPDERQSLLTFSRGIEREALRVTTAGQLSTAPHPEGFGSKLTHPTVTTDFSESQLELITPVYQSAEAAINHLDEVHRYVYTGLNDELLWSASMPCVLGEDANIPLADFGSSNLGRLKTTYRSGLGYRYGRGMQTICAVHYNFSFDDGFWHWLQDAEQAQDRFADFRTRRYFDLMRNFRRYSWLLTYLFGASPAVCNSFVKGKDHQLQAFDEGTVYLPYATSLRSGNLGYQSNTQSEHMKVCYNSLERYVGSLATAICTPHQAYQHIGIQVDGENRQVNANILQSEAEFYSSIRAKRVPPSGENFLACLLEQGVQYIEVRLLDVNPFLPLGIDAEQIKFLDAFLLFCLLSDSPEHDDELCTEVTTNSLLTVHNGRDPELLLSNQGTHVSLKDWAAQLLEDILPFAALLDDSHATMDFSNSLNKQIDRVTDAALTPSGRILAAMTSNQVPFFRFAMDKSLAHRAEFSKRPLSASEMTRYEQLAQTSRQAQQDIEANDDCSFDEYLAAIAAEYVPLADKP